MDKDRSLREHLLELLRGRGAHLDFDKAIAGLPPALCGAKAPGLPHTDLAAPGAPPARPVGHPGLQP
jgi:hypothetical protein